MVFNFAFEVAKLFLVGWEGVATKEDGKEVPLEFSLEAIERISDLVIAGFGVDIMFPYTSAVQGGGIGVAGDAIPN